MARPGQHDKLKPKVKELVESGATIAEVRQRFPELPEGTAKTWVRVFKTQIKSEIKSDSESDETNGAIAVKAEVVSSTPKLVSLPAGEESDYQLARRTVRAVLKSSEAAPHTKILAVGALAKLIEMRYNLPAHILDETTKSTLDEQRDRIRNLPPDEITRRYREAL